MPLRGIAGDVESLAYGATLRNFFTIPALMFLVACGNGQPPVQVVKLPNGRPLKILNVTKMTFSNDAPALVLNYQTDLKTTDTSALEKEVEEIWSFFRVDVERAGLTSGIIRANEVPKGFIISSGNAYGFVYHKGKDGQWSRQT